MNLVERAKKLAYHTHAGQVDMAGRPYIEHVERVAAAVSDDPEAEAVAWLHDVVEDQPWAEQDCWGTLPPNLMWVVLLLTRTKGAERQYYERIRRAPLALRVKLADIADNADEARLALLDDKTASRLRKKYAKARKALGADESK